uniref:Uncharacterized protein n=1 Tax=Pelusios castaneus TaxID=367368 RepID=A0A8C8S2T3_9SAUR
MSLFLTLKNLLSRRLYPFYGITWGDVKSLVSAAQRQLLRNHQEPTPDNLLIAIFAQLTPAGFLPDTGL